METPVNKLHAEMLMNEAKRKNRIALFKAPCYALKYVYEELTYSVILNNWDENINSLKE